MSNTGKRAAQGTGTIRKKTVTRNGKEYSYWEARATIGRDTGTGKQVQRSFTGSTQKEVAQKLKKALHEIDTGTYTEPAKATLSEWLDTWITEYVEPSCKVHTISTYQSRIDTHIKPMLGSVKLSALTTAQIQKFCNDLTRQKKLAPKTVKNAYGILHKALEQAYENRLISYNPASHIKLPRIEKKEINPLTEAEIASFLSESDGEPLRNLFIVALFTGMREGEICGLSWDAVDFDNGTITVRQQLQKDRKKGSSHFIATTKNSKWRTLTAAPYVMKVLKAQQIQQGKDRLCAGSAWSNEWNLVFTKPDGSHIPPQTALKSFKRVADRIGRPDARFHDLRHTYAVTSLQEGDSVKTVQENLGHATASFTLDVYGHVSEKMKRESAEHMEKFIQKMQA